MSKYLTMQNLAVVLLILGQGLAKWATPEFSWANLVQTLVGTVLGWVFVDQQVKYQRERLRLEGERVSLMKRAARFEAN